MDNEEDTFAQWLFYRFGNGRDDVLVTKGDGGEAWARLSEEDKLYWQHEADAVKRAVERGGFKRG